MFALAFGLGGIIGPFLVGTAMAGLGPIGFPVSLAVAVASYAVYAAYQQIRRGLA